MFPGINREWFSNKHYVTWLNSVFAVINFLLGNLWSVIKKSFKNTSYTPPPPSVVINSQTRAIIVQMFLGCNICRSLRTSEHSVSRLAIITIICLHEWVSFIYLNAHYEPVNILKPNREHYNGAYRSDSSL